MQINEKECEKANLSITEVKRIAAGLSRYGNQAKKIGITIFGGSQSGSLRFDDQKGNSQGRSLVLAFVDGLYDGGDGGCDEGEDGFLRGE